MSVDAVSELKQRWFSGPDSLEAAVNVALDAVGFSEAYIARVASTPRRPAAAARTKVVKDNVWGMVELDRGSQLLLDSPVIQRLRRIRQLGLTYLTYPSAEHTRFSHSLGMYCVIYHFLNSIRKNQGEESRTNRKSYGYDCWNLTDDLSADLLHAAILHDLGHMPFSHATENAVSSHMDRFVVGPREVEDFMLPAEDLLKKNLKLAELLSLLIILSPRFVKFYRQVVRPEPDDSIFRVASLIAGLAPSSAERGAAELISATAIDADKIDYINRDAQACGIPVGIDYARLFLRSAFLKVPRDSLHQLTLEKGLPDETMVLIVNASGVDTIEELAHARTSLYQRVYLHQVTLCAEALLERGLRGLAISKDPHCNVLNLWSDSDEGLVSALVRSPDESVRRYGENLQTRVLPKRALVIGKRLVSPRVNLSHFLTSLPSYVTTQLFKTTVGPALERLRANSVELRANSTKMETDIAATAQELAELVKKHRAELAPLESQKNEVMFLPIRDISAPHKDCLIVDNGQLMFSSSRNIAEEQSDALEIFKSHAYFVGPPEWREFNALAAVKVLSRSRSSIKKYDFKPSSREPGKVVTVSSIDGLVVNLDAASRRAGVDMERLRSISAYAAKDGFFDDCPRLYPHDSNCPDVAAVAQQLTRFSGEGSWSVTQASTLAFVNQFPPRLRRDLLQTLKRVHLLDRDALASALLIALNKIAAATVKKRLVVTGFSPDSGNLTRMLFEQELKAQALQNGWEIYKSIEDAFDRMDERSTLVLCDDNIVSGSQASCQLWAWMGVPKEKWPVDMRSEQGIFQTQLRPQDKENLRKHELAIAVAVGTEDARIRLAAIANELGISNFKGLYFANGLDEHRMEIDNDLGVFMQTVGAEILSWARLSREYSMIGGSDQEMCRQDSMGYRGARGLLATVFNVPVSTCTPLWCPGLFHGEPWVPLMIRRGYLNKLVVG